MQDPARRGAWPAATRVPTSARALAGLLAALLVALLPALLAATAHAQAPQPVPALSAPSEADRVAVERALRETQAWDWRARSLGQLSGGERQRVLLARALAVQAQVLLMDEPLANLDPPHQADWLALVQAQVREGRTVVSVLHEIGMALHADELVVMAHGHVVHQGPCDDSTTHRALEAVFDQRIAVRQIDHQWVALPRLNA